MSHISNFEADNANDLMSATPAPQKVGRTVRDFFTRKDACATPRRYIGTCQATATPARKLTFAPDIIAGVEEDDFGVEAAKDLTGRVWKVFKVSPLFRFNENDPEEMVSDLELHLQSYIDKVDTAELLRNSTVEDLSDPDKENQRAQDNLKLDKDKEWFWVSVDVVKGLRGHREDNEALRFQIKQNLKGVKGGNKEKIWSTCFFLSVDAREVSFYSKNVTQLPLCLTSGDSILNRLLLKGIEHRFDCIIHPLEIPEEELMWMSALWSNIAPAAGDQNKRNAKASTNSKSARKRKISENTVEPEGPTTVDNDNPTAEDDVTPVKGDELKFRFKLAHEVHGLDHIDVTFEGAQIRLIWENFHGKNGSQASEITHQEMERFHSALRNHACNSIKLRLNDRSLFILSQIWLPHLSVSDKGHIFIKKGFKHVKSILRELTKHCEGSTQRANPRLATSQEW